MIRVKDKKFYRTEEISFKWLPFLTVLPRAVFITQSKGYGGAFLQKIIINFQLLTFFAKKAHP